MAVERWLRDARHKRPILPFTFPTIINDDRWTDDKPVVPGRFEAGWVKYKHKKRSMEIEQEEREKEEAMEKKKKQEEEEAEREEGHYEKKRKRDNEEERRGKGKEKEEGEKEKEKEVDAGEAGEEEARAQKKVRIDVEQESFWSVIPPEIVLNYSAYLPLDDIARYSQTCKQIYSMLQDETFWKHLYVQRFGLPRVILDPTIPWKTRYKNKHLSFYTTHIAWSRYLLHIARFSDSDEEVLGMMELEHLKELCRIHRLSDSPASRATLQRLLLDSLRKGDVKELFPRSIFEPLFQLLDQQQIEK
ncbi:Unconventional myosin-VI [Balamuthia mandrillaris]